MKKLGLVPKLLLGIAAGIIIGLTLPEMLARAFYTVTNVFGEFLTFVVPLIILGFIVSGIAELGDKAGKLLGVTVGIAYFSTFLAGLVAYFVGSSILPLIITEGTMTAGAEGGLEPFLELEIPPMMDVMTALVTAFIFGLGINYISNGDRESTLLNFILEFRRIIKLVIKKVILPLLPVYIAGVFADLAFAGEVFQTLGVFGQVFALVIALHLGYLLLLYLFTGQITGEKPLSSLRNMLPAYTTALGTMSSAATIPVTLKSAKENNISDQIGDFVIPLSATIHLAGSAITLILCSIAVLLMHGGTLVFWEFLPFIVMLGIVMVAAPGVPGGAVMAALGLLTTLLGFGDSEQALIIGLYMAQDGFGTACNVTGDGAIALLVNSVAEKLGVEYS